MTNYLFSTHPVSFKQFGWIVLTGFLLLIILGIVLQIYLKRLKGYHITKRLIKKIIPWTYITGSLGLLLWFVRYERAPYISMRFILWFLIFGSLVWLGMIVLFDVKQWGERRKKRDDEIRRRKYLK